MEEFSAKYKVNTLKNQIKELEEQLEKEAKDKLAVKKQAENLAREYDHLAEEHSKLQKKITISGTGDDKKDD